MQARHAKIRDLISSLWIPDRRFAVSAMTLQD
jgi:hypothetical protein